MRMIRLGECAPFNASICAPFTRRQHQPSDRDWYFIAEQPALAPHLAHPEGCAALRIVLVTVPRVSRSCEHFLDRFDLHLLQPSDNASLYLARLVEVPDFVSRVSGFGIRVSSFRFSGFRSRVSDFRVSGFGVRGWTEMCSSCGDVARTPGRSALGTPASCQGSSSQFKNNYSTEMCLRRKEHLGSEAGSYARLIDLCFTQR